MIRAFFGISLTPKLTDQLRQDFLPIESTLIPIDPKFYHITLKFMAHIEPEALAKLSDFAHDLFLNTPSFDLQVKKIGVFPHLGGRVVAAFIAPNPHLLALHLQLDQEGLRFGVPRDIRRYRPHITLGKIKSVSTEEPINLIRESAIKIQVNNIVLYESRPGPKGSVYIPLRVFKLT
jgi:2'-5' RNA ligase